MEQDSHEVHSITDAPQRHSEEQHSRMLRYGLAMALRMVCFILAGVTALVWETWWSLAFVAAAVVLPYVAVVDANAGGDRYVRGNEADSPELLLGTGDGDSAAEGPHQWWEQDDDVFDPAGTNSEGSPDRESAEDGDDVIPGEVIRDNRH